ncbi:hypothetical protein [Arthrobacter sp. NPDC058127]|uniref:hypothetical protein n=1 Tax=Arthrobacter sp. NPDC058127 TaxID=3346351 RepID=UPI0036EF1B86
MNDPLLPHESSTSFGTNSIPEETALVFDSLSIRTDVGSLPPVLFGQDIWPLHHLDNSETQTSLNIDFRKVVQKFRRPAKILIFNLLNTDAARRTIYFHRPRLAPSSVARAFRVFLALAKWLNNRGIGHLSDMSSADLDDYAITIESKKARASSKVAELILISRIFAHNAHLRGDIQFCEPPWFGQKMTDWIPGGSSTISNQTEPIEPEVLEPLLIAAFRIIDGYLDGTLPMDVQCSWYLARKWAKEEPGGPFEGRAPTAAAAAIISRFENATNWVPDFSKSHVRGAGLIVIGYLTGMRPTELLHLKADCLEVVDKSDASGIGVRRYQITGRTFKGVRDPSGNTLTGGIERDQPWVTIEPVERAVRAMRQLGESCGESEFLFTRLYQPRDELRSRRGQAITADMAAVAIEGMVRVWNRRAANDPSMLRIPNDSCDDQANAPDPSEQTSPSDQFRPPLATSMVNGVEEIETPRSRRAPTLSRFRRTLAWHIVNRPGGVVALGIQYGHYRQLTSMGYAGRSESGFPDELEFEQLLSSWNNLDALANESEEATISGPAAARLQDGISLFKEQFSGSVKNPKQLTRLKAAGLQRIYDNPKAMVVCVFNPVTAACNQNRSDPEGNLRETPDLDNCSPICPNLAQLDSHIAKKQKVRDGLEEEIEYLPEILADRNRRRIVRLDLDISRHRKRGAGEDSEDSNDSAR